MALKYRVVVVGLGSIGKRHARLLQERTDVTVEVLEPDEAILRNATGEIGELVSHSHFKGMLESKPDVVWLCTPTALHADQSIAALESDCHVFCEKPMCETLEEAFRVKSISDRVSRVFNVGFYLHFWQGMVRAKQLINQGELGTILHLHARVGTYQTLINTLSRYQSERQGSLFFDYSHQPDLFYWLVNKIPTSVYVPGFQAGDMEFTSAPNVADIICEYDTPLISTIHLNYVQLPQRHEYEIVGDKGWVLVDFEKSQLLIGKRQNQTIEMESFVQDRDDIFRAEHQAFFEAIEGKRKAETTALDGIVSTAICQGAKQSWKKKEKITLELNQS
jgi:predicted dehydrogenase